MFTLPEKIKNGIPEYGDTVRRFIAGEIAPARFTGVRVPWGNYNQRGGTLYMSRIRLPAGICTPRQLQAMAFCARDFGNGVLHLTTRQDIQIHDLTAANIIKVHEYLRDFDLSSRGGGGNTVRNVTACYLAGVCPEEIFDVSGDATAATEQLIVQDTSYTMPRKFKIAFSGCPTDCARCMVNDVGLVATQQKGASGYRIFVGGGMGARSIVGRELESFVPRNQIGNVINAVKNVFHTHGDRKNKHRNRLRFLIDGMGLERFKELYQAERARLETAEPVRLREIPEAPLPDNPAAGTRGHEADNLLPFIASNVIPQKQKGYVTVRLRIPRGDLDWQQAKALARLQGDFPELQFRVTQEQGLCLVNIRAQDLHKLHDRLQTTLKDFLHPGTLLDIVACKGSRTCNLGVCNSPGLAEELERMIAAEFVGKKVFQRVNIHINGCPNSCGQHPLGSISFVGAVRRFEGRPVPHYKLWLGGRMGVPDTRLAKDTGILLPARNIPAFVKDFLNRMETEINGSKSVDDFLVERGPALAAELKAKYDHVPSYEEGRDFYFDWGGTEEFSMQGLGPGECGAGVVDMIESDLNEAAAALASAGNECAAAKTRQALFYAARALLVVRGSDPKRPVEAFRDFMEKLIGPGIASVEYAGLNDVYESLEWNPNEAVRREAHTYAANFLAHVKELYGRMDPTFNFPAKT